MTPVPVIALEPVRDDVQSAYDYFEDRLRGAGDAFLERYFATTDRIGTNAEVYPIKFGDYRRALVPRSNMAVYYFIEPNHVVVIAVIDARRNPRLIRRLLRRRR